MSLPDFRLEVYLGRHEFTAPHHLTASDAQTISIRELLALDGPESLDRFLELGLGYTPTWGDAALREAIAATYATMTPDHVLCCAGAEEAMFLALQALVGPGDHAILTVPNYQSMETLILDTGAEATGLLLDEHRGWALDLDALTKAIRPNTRLIAVNFPNNPTGALPDAPTFRALAELCQQRGIRLFSDEVYRGLERDAAHMLPQAADLSPTAISLNVMSKAYGLPGLRVGWLACQDRDLLARLEKHKHYTSICNAGPSEYLATVALRHGDTLKNRNRARIARNLPLFEAMFARHPDRLEWEAPQAGCVCFPRYKGPEGAEAFCEALVAQAGVVLLPGSIYRSPLARVPEDRFRIGVGRDHPEPALAALESFLSKR